MTRLAVIGLRIAIVVMFLGMLSAQLWFIPQLARDSAEEWPELAYLAVPYTGLWIIVAACVQTVLVALWALLAKVRRGAIFTETAFAWVNAIIVAGAVATVLVFGLEIHVLGIVDVGGPPLGVLLTGISTAGGAFVLIMIVMRSLLRSATNLQSELEEVV
jgi:hypothetical protein